MKIFKRLIISIFFCLMLVFTGFFSVKSIKKSNANNFGITANTTCKTFSKLVNFSGSNFTSTWSSKSWNGLTNFDGSYIWTDGQYIYYSSGSSQYVLDISTSTWSSKSWNGLTNFSGSNIWTDGQYIYYSSGSSQYVLDISTSTWSSKSWNGLTNFNSSNIWTDSQYIYYSSGSSQYVLDISTSTWSSKSWNGLVAFNGSSVWTNGQYIYCFAFSQYVLDISTSTWSSKSWNGFNPVSINLLWSDDFYIYSSNGSSQYVLDISTSTWSSKSWNGFNPTGSRIWTDGQNIYYSYLTSHYYLQRLISLEVPFLEKSSFNQISWSNIQNAHYYEIYKDNELYDTTEDTLYTCDSLGNYQVKAVGDGEIYVDSDFSNIISISSTQLNTPIISLNNDLITWSNIQNASSYQIYLDNELIDTVDSNSFTITQNGSYKVKSISNNVFFTNSNFSNTLVVNYQFAKVVFYSKDNITELIVVENWLIGKNIENFSNTFYSYNSLITSISLDSGIDSTLITNGSYKILFNDNQLFTNPYFDKYYIVSSDVHIYYKIDKSFTTSNAYNLSDYTVTSSNSDTLFINNGQNLIHDISLSSIDVNFDVALCGTTGSQTSSIITRSLDLFDGFEIGHNFSIYTDSYGNKFYFDSFVSQTSLSTTYVNYLYKCEILSNTFIFPSMDYNKFIFYDEENDEYQFVQSSGSTIISYVSSIFETTYKINQYNNFYYCNYIGFSFDIQNYSGTNNMLFSFIEDTNNKFYQYYYNYSGYSNNQNNFEYILINSNNFNNYKYNKTYLYFQFDSLLKSQGLSSTYTNKNDCLSALENLSIKFSFGNPILYYYDSTDKNNSSTGTGLIPSDSSGLYKTNFAWYDVTGYLYNFFIYIIFDMPIVSSITKLVYQIINLILFVFNQIILLFNSVTNNIFLVSILGFLILKFVIGLIVKH